MRTGTTYHAFYHAFKERDRIGCWSPSSSAKQLHANSWYKEVNKEQNGKWIAISIFQVISFLQKNIENKICSLESKILQKPDVEMHRKSFVYMMEIWIIYHNLSLDIYCFCIICWLLITFCLKNRRMFWNECFVYHNPLQFS